MVKVAIAAAKGALCYFDGWEPHNGVTTSLPFEADKELLMEAGVAAVGVWIFDFLLLYLYN